MHAYDDAVSAIRHADSAKSVSMLMPSPACQQAGLVRSVRWTRTALIDRTVRDQPYRRP